MGAESHRNHAPLSVSCAVLTVSDTRTEETDTSGRTIREALLKHGHGVAASMILPDEPVQIVAQVRAWLDLPELHAVIINGGTGVSRRDGTFEAISGLLEKTLPGFGELFRMLSYAEIGAAAMLSRATAGLALGKILISLPGSTHAVRLALDKLILPELRHLVGEARR